MNRLVSCILATIALSAAVSAEYNSNSGYNGGYDDGRGYNSGVQQGYNKYVAPKVAILNHKQALGTDGSFNYAFNAENGIQQGESISPDGSRHGSYSYVDPSGKTVSLKYVADREGFRVVEGDHIPRAPPLPAQHAAAYQAAAKAQAETASYQGSSYQNPSYQSGQYRQQYNSAEGEDDGRYYEPSNQNYQSGAYSAETAEAEHTGPHSFGNGFSFQFGGGKY